MALQEEGVTLNLEVSGTSAPPGLNGYCSESFDIIGTPNASTVPEPRGIFLFGTALTLIGAAIRKRFGLLPIGRERPASARPVHLN
jgi:hypothetical protein